MRDVFTAVHFGCNALSVDFRMSASHVAIGGEADISGQSREVGF